MEDSNNNTNPFYMGKPSKRVVDLPLLKIRLPVGGMVSILHRVSGVLLVLLIPLMTYLLQQSLAGPAEFLEIRQLLQSVWFRLVLWMLLILLIQHLFSGIRHLLLDLDIGIEKSGSIRSAWGVFVTTGLVAIISAWRLFL